MFKLKIIFVLWIALTTFNIKKSYALSLYEMSLVGIGVGFLANQYFDSTLEKTNTFQKKTEIIDKFYNSKRSTVSSKYFYNLPLQEQLLVVEQLESF